MRVKRFMYWRNLERMADSPWREVMLVIRSAMKGASFVGSLFVASDGVPEDVPEPVMLGAYAGFCCWKFASPSVIGAGSIRGEIFIRPVGTSQRRSHHSG